VVVTVFPLPCMPRLTEIWFALEMDAIPSTADAASATAPLPITFLICSAPVRVNEAFEGILLRHVQLQYAAISLLNSSRIDGCIEPASNQRLGIAVSVHVLYSVRKTRALRKMFT
jgi:hypothetical protein